MMTKSRRPPRTGDTITGALMTGQDVPGASYLSSCAGVPAADGSSNQTQQPTEMEKKNSLSVDEYVCLR